MVQVGREPSDNAGLQALHPNELTAIRMNAAPTYHRYVGAFAGFATWPFRAFDCRIDARNNSHVASHALSGRERVRALSPVPPDAPAPMLGVARRAGGHAEMDA